MIRNNLGENIENEDGHDNEDDDDDEDPLVKSRHLTSHHPQAKPKYLNTILFLLNIFYSNY